MSAWDGWAAALISSAFGAGVGVVAALGIMYRTRADDRRAQRADAAFNIATELGDAILAAADAIDAKDSRRFEFAVAQIWQRAKRLPIAAPPHLRPCADAIVRLCDGVSIALRNLFDAGRRNSLPQWIFDVVGRTPVVIIEVFGEGADLVALVEEIDELAHQASNAPPQIA